MFRQRFDTALRETPVLQGGCCYQGSERRWEKMQYRQEDLYSGKHITNKEYNTYELSSGGSEGITVRDYFMVL